MTIVAVIGGTSPSLNSSSIRHAAVELGGLLAQSGTHVMTCGVGSGVIGILLESLRDSSIERSAIVLRGIEERHQHHAAGLVTLVDTIEERKEFFMMRASELVALPGGLGTYDEILSFISLMKGGSKKVTLLNVNGYFDPLLDLLVNTINFGFANPQVLHSIRVLSDVKEIAGYL